MLRPDIVGMRGFIVIRLRPCIPCEPFGGEFYSIYDLHPPSRNSDPGSRKTDANGNTMLQSYESFEGPVLSHLLSSPFLSPSRRNSDPGSHKTDANGNTTLQSYESFEGRVPSHLLSSPFFLSCLLYTSPSPRDKRQSRMPSSA